MTEDRIQLKAILATAVANNIMSRGTMKNIQKTPYWYFKPKEENKDE